MAVTSFLEIWNGRDGEMNDERVRQYKRVFRIVTDSPATGPVEMSANVACPLLFDAYVGASGEVDLGCVVRNIRFTNDSDNYFIWQCDVHYSSETQDPDQVAESPFDEPVLMEWSFQQYEKCIPIDFKGNAFTSSAGEVIDPPVKIDDSRLVLRIERNLPGFNVALAIAYQDAVNSDVFFGAAALTAKIMTLSGSFHYRNGIPFWHVAGEVHFRREGWRLQLLDQGFTHQEIGFDFNTPPKINRDPDTNEVYPKPLLLNGQGLLLSEAHSVLQFALNAVETVLSTTANSMFALPSEALGPVIFQIDDEQILVLSQNAVNLTWNVVRGVNGTTAAAHLAAAVVQQMPMYQVFFVYEELPFAALNFF